jgi:thioredoxin 1
MPSLTLDHNNSDQLSSLLAGDGWIVACLCAAWCGSCRDYRAGFDEMAERHPEKHFIWIDIEDQADVVGDLDVDNFPTLLIQHGETVAFFGPMQPDHRLAERLLLALVEQDINSLQAKALGSAESREWQKDCNLRALLRAVQA